MFRSCTYIYAQGRLRYVHTPKVLGCTPPAIIRHFSFRSAPCHDIRRFTGHMRTKLHIGVYPLSTLPMPNTTATQWCPIGIVIHGYRRCKSRAVRPFAAVSPTSSLFIIAIVGGLIILGVLPRCLYHIIGLGGTSLGVGWADSSWNSCVCLQLCRFAHFFGATWSPLPCSSRCCCPRQWTRAGVD